MGNENESLDGTDKTLRCVPSVAGGLKTIPGWALVLLHSSDFGCLSFSLFTLFLTLPIVLTSLV